MVARTVTPEAKNYPIFVETLVCPCTGVTMSESQMAASGSPNPIWARRAACNARGFGRSLNRNSLRCLAWPHNPPGSSRCGSVSRAAHRVASQMALTQEHPTDGSSNPDVEPSAVGRSGRAPIPRSRAPAYLRSPGLKEDRRRWSSGQ